MNIFLRLAGRGNVFRFIRPAATRSRAVTAELMEYFPSSFEEFARPAHEWSVPQSGDHCEEERKSERAKELAREHRPGAARAYRWIADLDRVGEHVLMDARACGVFSNWESAGGG